jgi:HPt (histidine-containing phosphotransfer) domain-containing protein
MEESVVRLDQGVLASLRELGGTEAPDLVEQLGQAFAESSRSSLAAARTALEGGNLVGLRSAAHALKGSCLAIGALAMGALAARLETQSRCGEVDDAPRLIAALEGELAAVCAELPGLTPAP